MYGPQVTGEPHREEGAGAAGEGKAGERAGED